MKRGKRHMTEGTELSNQEKIRTLGEKETNKFLGILEADTINKWRWKKKKIKKSISGERKSYSKPNHKNISKGINTWAVPLVRYSGPFFWVAFRRTWTNELENKKTNDHA